MSSIEQFSADLPEGVTALDFGPFVVEFARSGKIVLLAKEHGGKHLTINLGGRSGILEAHLTNPGAADPHTPLGGIRTSDLTLLLEKASPSIEENLLILARRTMRQVRFGWLRHHGIYVLPFWPGGSRLEEIGTRHGKRLKIAETRFLERFGRPLGKSEVRRAPDAAFWLYRAGTPSDQPYGALFKYTDDRGGVRFLWFKTARVVGELWKLWRAYEPVVRGVLLGPTEVAEAIAREETAGAVREGPAPT
jgi:hypothetical protein